MYISILGGGVEGSDAFLRFVSFVQKGGGDLKNESRGFLPVHDYTIVFSIEGKRKKKEEKKENAILPKHASWKCLYM